MPVSYKTLLKLLEGEISHLEKSHYRLKRLAKESKGMNSYSQDVIRKSKSAVNKSKEHLEKALKELVGE